jgi:Cdc6-like AAA superfamily ATPase
MSKLTPAKLTEPDYKIYRESIFKLAFAKKSSSSAPKAYILAGQPGSGKGSITRDINSSKKFVVVDPDDFRVSHPKYIEYNHITTRKLPA